MKISPDASLYHVADLMGGEAFDTDAERLIAMLVDAGYGGWDHEDIPLIDWFRATYRAMNPTVHMPA